MLYNRRPRSSALFILLTSTTTLALYIPRSKITTTTTTTTTSKTTFIWSGLDQNQRSDPFNEDTATLPFTCFTCPMNPELLHEIWVFAPVDERGDLPEPRALVCEYDTNESLCRYDPVRTTLGWSLSSSLTPRHPAGDWHASHRPAFRGFLFNFCGCVS